MGLVQDQTAVDRLQDSIDTFAEDAAEPQVACTTTDVCWHGPLLKHLAHVPAALAGGAQGADTRRDAALHGSQVCKPYQPAGKLEVLIGKLQAQEPDEGLTQGPVPGGTASSRQPGPCWASTCAPSRCRAPLAAQRSRGSAAAPRTAPGGCGGFPPPAPWSCVLHAG